MKTLSIVFLSAIMAMTAMGEDPTKLELTASKDTFGRSAERNRNSGAAPLLLVSPIPGVASLVGFDLSAVTNEILSAEFSFRIQENERRPLSFVVSTMVLNEKNGTWVEGRGSSGIRGQVAELDEATYQWRAFRDRAWKNAEGRNVRNLRDEELWTTLTSQSAVPWEAGKWITIPIENPAFLEAARNHEVQIVTFGLWGTSGNGVYKIDSKESGYAAKLSLTLKAAPESAPSE